MSEAFTYIDANVVIDSAGRVINPAKVVHDDPYQPEDPAIFTSSWLPQILMKPVDSDLSSRYVWPLESKPVLLTRLDIYQNDNPLSQQCSTNLAESRRIRNSGQFYPLRSVFFMGDPSHSTTEMVLERVGPPPRTRLRPFSKKNGRDQTFWTKVETVNAFSGALGTLGAVDWFVDWTDGPDRYLLSSNLDPTHGWRRLWRFGAYSATQYYILERRIESSLFDCDLGWADTYNIVRGSTVYAEKHWRLIGSFYAFDLELPCTNKYTVYTREDPFRRIIITMDESFDDADNWQVAFSFYAFDIPVPGTCAYYLHHSLRSINSTDAGVRRHRLHTGHPQFPWEFRMNIYVFPAALEDCTINQTPPPRPAYDYTDETNYDTTGDYAATEGYDDGYKTYH